MIKYSKFTDNTGSGNLTDTFSQITNKFQKTGGGEGVLQPLHTPLLGTPLTTLTLYCQLLNHVMRKLPLPPAT